MQRIRLRSPILEAVLGYIEGRRPRVVVLGGLGPERASRGALERSERSSMTESERGLLPAGPEGKTAKNRVHLDVRAAPGLAPDARRARLTEESARLIELGATKLYEFEERGAFWITMQDPEGNEFCLD